MTTALANFGLSLLATISAAAAWAGVGSITGYWNLSVFGIALGVAGAVLFAWRKRPPFAATAVLGIVGGALMLFGGGPDIGGVTLGAYLCVFAVVALFLPLFEIFAS